MRRALRVSSRCLYVSRQTTVYAVNETETLNPSLVWDTMNAYQKTVALHAVTKLDGDVRNAGIPEQDKNSERSQAP